MIIFDLDGTLANCEHRRHFVDPSKNDNYLEKINPGYMQISQGYFHKDTGEKFKPDWKAFYEACDKDEPIHAACCIWNAQISLGRMGQHMIWSGRCESVREKTNTWLKKHLLCFDSHQLKMRPISNNTPDERLKEGWLDEAVAAGEKIDFVFDDRPNVVRMWRRRGVFVFNCAQSNE